MEHRALVRPKCNAGLTVLTRAVEYGRPSWHGTTIAVMLVGLAASDGCRWLISSAVLPDATWSLCFVLLQSAVLINSNSFAGPSSPSSSFLLVPFRHRAMVRRLVLIPPHLLLRSNVDMLFVCTNAPFKEPVEGLEPTPWLSSAC